MLLTSDNDLAQEAELTRMGLYTIAKVFEVKLQYLINKFNISEGKWLRLGRGSLRNLHYKALKIFARGFMIFIKEV